MIGAGFICARAPENAAQTLDDITRRVVRLIRGLVCRSVLIAAKQATEIAEANVTAASETVKGLAKAKKAA